MADGDADVLIKIAADVASASAGINELVGVLTSFFQGAQEGMAGVADASEKSSATVQTNLRDEMTLAVAAGEALEKVGEKFGEMASEAVKALPEMVSHAADLGDELLTMSRRIGVSVEAMSEFRFVASQTGASMEGMGRAVMGLSQNLDGSGEKADKFRTKVETLGIDFDKLKAQKPEDAFFAIIEQLQKLPTEGEKSAAAMELFGNRFRNSTMLLREDIPALREEFNRLGLSISTEFAEKGDAFKDAIDVIHKSQEAWRNHLAEQLLPTITQLLKSVPQLGGALVTLGEAFYTLAASMAPVLLNFALMKGATITAVTEALYALGESAVVAAADLLLLIAPYAAIAAAVGVTLAAVYELTGGWATWSKVLDEGKKRVQEMWQFLKDLWTIFKFLADGVSGYVTDTFTKLKDLFNQYPALLTALKIAFFPVVAVVKELVWAYKELIEAWKWATGNAHKVAEGIREEEQRRVAAKKALEDQTKAQNDLNAAKAKETGPMYGPVVTPGMEAARATQQAFDALTKSQKESIEANTKAGATAKELAGVMATEMKVSAATAEAAITKYLDAVKEAKKVADSTPFAKLIQQGIDLAKEFDAAKAAGASNAQIFDAFGKKAEDLAKQAALVPGALKQIPPELRQLATDFEVFTKAKKDLAEYKKEIEKLEQMKQPSWDWLKGMETVKPALKDIHQGLLDAATDGTAFGATVEDLQRGGEMLSATLVKLGDKALMQSVMPGLDATKTRAAQTRDAMKAAEFTTADWTKTIGDLAKSFSQFATIAGGSFGGVIKSIGTGISGLDVMTKGLAPTFAKGGLFGEGGGIGGAFGAAKGATEGFGGALKGISGVIGQVGMIGSAAMMAVNVGMKLFDAFTVSKGEDAAKDVGKKFGVTITEEAGNAIAANAKKMFQGDRVAAELYGMKDIVKAGGGIIADNFKMMTDRLHDVFTMIDTGKFTVEQGTKVLSENFGAFADYVTKTGKIADKSFTDIIALQQKFGTKSTEITDFVSGQTARFAKSLVTVMAPQSKALADYADHAKAIIKDMDGLTEGTAEYAEKAAELNQLNADSAAGWDKMRANMGRFENLAVAGFNAALKSGVPFLDAVNAMGPALDEVSKANETLGRTGGDAIQELLHFRDLTQTNKELVESTGALNEMMLALSNIGGLNAQTFADMEAQGKDTFDQLTAAGFTSNQALQQMKGYLESVMDAHTKLGLPIDENTQKLLDQATAAGVVSDAQMSMNDIMMQGLSAVIKALGGDVPDAFTKAAKAADDLKAKGTDATTAIADGATNVASPALAGMGQAGEDAATQMQEALQKQAQAALDDTAAKGVAAGQDIAKTFATQTLPATEAVAGAVAKIGDKATNAASTTHDAAASMVNDWGAVEGAATGAAEGHSPTGIKQIIVRTEEAQAAVEEAAKAMVAAFGDIFVAATDVGDAIWDTKQKVEDEIEAYEKAPAVVAAMTAAQKAFIDQAKAAGVSVSDIADVLGLSSTAIQLYIDTQKASADATKAANDELTKATDTINKYTVAQQEAITANLASGMSIDGIAKKTGLTTSQVQAYLDALAAAKDASDKLHGATTPVGAMAAAATAATSSSQQVGAALGAMQGGGAGVATLATATAWQAQVAAAAGYTFNITIEGPTFWDDPNSVRPITEAVSQQLMDRLRQTRQVGL